MSHDPTRSPDVVSNATMNAAVDALLLASVAIAASRTPGGYLPGPAIGALAVGAVVWFAGARALGQYNAAKPKRPLNDFALTSLLVLAVVLAIRAVHLVLPAFAPSTRVARLVAMLWPASLVVRICVRGGRWLADAPPRSVLMVGSGPLAHHTAIAIASAAERARVIGFLALPGDVHDARLEGPTLGDAGDLEKTLREYVVDEVYIAVHVRNHGDLTQDLVRTCERFGIPFALPAADVRMGRACPSSDALADGYVHYQMIKSKPNQRLLKRGIDFVTSAVALFVLSPLLAAIALAIKVTSRGPILFRQERVGLYGRTFHMLKFRSMVTNAEALQQALLADNEQSGPVFKIKHDPRITRVGRFLRKHSLDELPQLVNILRGDMTIVGPRPPLPSEVAKYEAWQMRRLSVRPGLTCVWQISGRNEISFEQWMYLDMQYIDHWSLAEDVGLILKTVPIVLSGRGAS